MPSIRRRLGRLFGELKRRRVIRVGAAYAIAGWIVIEVAETTFPYLGLPDITVTAVIVLVLLGLPLALALSWAYDITPAGVQRTPDLETERRPASGFGGSATATAAAPTAAAGAATLPTLPATGPAERDNPQRRHPSASSNGSVRLIAIPFRMLRPDPETDFLAFSLPEAVTSSLAGIGSVVVRSQLAALRYAGDTPDLDEIAARTQVDVVLSGTLLRIGEKIGVTAQLTDAHEGTLLWSEAAQVELGDLFQLQEQLSRRIVDSLRLPLTDRERQGLSRDIPADERAYELYLRANRVAYEAGRWEEARDLYIESVGLDPGYPPAWARLGRCHRLIGKFARDDQAAQRSMADAVSAFERALAINPDLSLAHNLYAQLEVDLGKAESAMTRLLGRARASPRDAQIHAGLVHACRFLGLLDASLAAHRAARRVDPEIATSVGHTYWMLGDYERALEHTHGDIGYLAGVTLASMGREAQAMEGLRRAEAALEPSSWSRAYVASLRVLLEGDRPSALAALADARSSRQDGEAVYYLARSYARLGERDPALAELEAVVDLGFVCVPLFARDPWLGPLRDEPRFEKLVARAGMAHRRGREAFERAGGEALLASP